MTRARVADLRQRLGERDWAIIRDVERFGVMAAGQLKRLHFTDGSPQSNARSCRRVLERLAAEQILVRLGRSIGGQAAGSSAHLYSLSVAGQRLLHPDTTRRFYAPDTPSSNLFLGHRLMVTELGVRLREAQHAGTLELVTFDSEPAAWRSFTSPTGGTETLKPDGYVEVAVGDYVDSYFLEADLATEGRGALTRKLDQYARYYATGQHQHANGGSFPRVLFVVPTEHRQEQLVNIIGRQPAELWQLYRVVTFEHFQSVILGGAS